MEEVGGAPTPRIYSLSTLDTAAPQGDPNKEYALRTELEQERLEGLRKEVAKAT